MRSGLVCAANPGKKDGTGTDAEFNTPNGVCMANNGRLAFVVEGSALAATGSVRQIVVATGAVTRVAGIGGAGSPLDGIGYNNRFYYPKACAATADGSIVYVIEAATNHNRLRKVVVDTKVVTTVAGVLSSTAPSTVDGQGTNAQFNIPTGIALGDDASMAYIADFDGNTIRQVELASGTVTTFAGSGNDGYADGVGTVAEFDQPTGIAFSASSATSASPSGVLYVTDANNYRVRRIDVATHQVTTVTGLGTSGNDDGHGGVETQTRWGGSGARSNAGLHARGHASEAWPRAHCWRCDLMLAVVMPSTFINLRMAVGFALSTPRALTAASNRECKSSVQTNHTVRLDAFSLKVAAISARFSIASSSSSSISSAASSSSATDLAPCEHEGRADAQRERVGGRAAPPAATAARGMLRARPPC